VIRKIAASLLIIMGGFIGITFFFSDFGPGETWVSRFTVAFAYYLVLSAVIRLLTNSKFAFLALWGVGLVALLSLPSIFTDGLRSFAQEFFMIGVPLLGMLVGNKVIKFFKSRIGRK